MIEQRERYAVSVHMLEVDVRSATSQRLVEVMMQRALHHAQAIAQGSPDRAHREERALAIVRYLRACLVKGSPTAAALRVAYSAIEMQLESGRAEDAAEALQVLLKGWSQLTGPTA